MNPIIDLLQYENDVRPYCSYTQIHLWPKEEPYKLQNIVLALRNDPLDHIECLLYF